MKVILVYLRIVKRVANAFPAPRPYDESTKRFLKTYLQHKPKIPHDVLVVNCGGYKPDTLLDSIANDYVTSIGTGFDCGTYQEVNCALLKYDLVVAMNTHVYFWRDNWLEPIVAAARHHGPGFYGPTASYERNPHLRTPCIAYHPGLMSEYPTYPKNRDECGDCEAGPNNFALWSDNRGFPTLLITGDGKAWAKQMWRHPPNIFRRGDQSNILIFDRHIDVYKESTNEQKILYARQADKGA